MTDWLPKTSFSSGALSTLCLVYFSGLVLKIGTALFFGCQFSAGIWLRILRLCGNSRMPRNWENEFLWVITTKGKSFYSITKRIAWGATIYHLWRQRNSRIHENIFSPADAIFHLICNDVRLRVSGIQKVDDNPSNRSMCERWSFPLTI